MMGYSSQELWERKMNYRIVFKHTKCPNKIDQRELILKKSK